MEKKISKPDNWQDFESLCKKLWGEIWQIPHKVKTNGRLGQRQNGVDVYGKPKNEKGYWGVQCKGKDEYSHAKLTKKEIDKEIKEAMSFKPKLEVFIIATSANKDVEIEEHVRIKDLEYQKKGLFEILLFCWEDIVDLIKENRDTYNYYINQQQFKSKFDFEVYLNEFSKEYTLEPTFFRIIKRYKVKAPRKKLTLGEGSPLNLNQRLEKQFELLSNVRMPISDFLKPNYNHAIEDFELIIKNTGSNVIEDWRVTFELQGNYRKFYDSKYNNMGPGMAMIDLHFEEIKRTYCEENKIYFRPKDNQPLIQKDNTFFEITIIPEPKEYDIIVSWKLLARDFNKEGEVVLKVKPKFNDEYEYVYVESEEELLEDELISVRETEREEKDIGDKENSK